jgi:hypothetical protein
MKTSLIAAGLAVASLLPTPASAAQDCVALANLKIDNTNLLSATEVPASGDGRSPTVQRKAAAFVR